jgi:hypothetical protein
MDLKKKDVIKRVPAAMMMLLFQFSITRKLLLHNLVADHQDTPLSANSGKNPQLRLAGFNCACDNQVVESPFIENTLIVKVSLRLLFLIGFPRPSADSYLRRFYTLAFADPLPRIAEIPTYDPLPKGG